MNGTVDAADYVVWRNGLGPIFAQYDYNAWRANFGENLGIPATGVASSQTAVPEPTTLVLLMIAAATDWCLRRGRAA